MHLSFVLQHILLLCLLSHIHLAISAWPTEGPDSDIRQFFDRNAVGAASESEHTNNWAVLVCASRYWFNYRVGAIIFTLWKCDSVISFWRSIWPTL